MKFLKELITDLSKEALRNVIVGVILAIVTAIGIWMFMRSSKQVAKYAIEHTVETVDTFNVEKAGEIAGEFVNEYQEKKKQFLKGFKTTKDTIN